MTLHRAAPALFIFALASLPPMIAVSGESPLFDSYEAFRQRLTGVAHLEDASERRAELDILWQQLETRERFPFVQDGQVAFLYRGPARSISFVGDFNGWDPDTRQATRLGASEVWLQEESFPLDARLDYKIVRDGTQWILDPANDRIQRSGFGDNSELRMPEYVPSPYVDSPPEERGVLADAFSVSSDILGQVIQVRVYTPHGYDHMDGLPAVYVTDGHEYADDRMGSMVPVLDNLIDRELIPPVVAVFVDPRVDGKNVRSDHYILNPKFAGFLAEELVPLVDAEFKTRATRDHRAILGTSLGGLNAAYVGFSKPETFRHVVAQSPAFQFGDRCIFDLYRESDALDLSFFMTWGTFSDFGDTTGDMLALLQDKGYPVEHRVVNEGHSWGNWRALLDDAFIHLWGEGGTPTDITIAR